MSIKIKEIKKSVNSYTGGNSGDLNATDDFKKSSNANLSEISEILKDDNKTAKELIKSLDDLVYTILDYRYNIVDYSHYSDDDACEMTHLKIN